VKAWERPGVRERVEAYHARQEARAVVEGSEWAKGSRREVEPVSRVVWTDSAARRGKK
jgi:hypothetical protein